MLCSPAFFFAQDTLYFDSEWKEVDLENHPDFFRVITQNNEDPDRALVRDYFISGQVRGEKHYSDYEEKKLDKVVRRWDEGGNLLFEADYKKGRRHGILSTYWENGEMRRRDHYKRGKFKEGTCWNAEGEEIEYFPYEVRPEFPGGKRALIEHIKTNIQDPKPGRKGQSRVVVSFKINPEGAIEGVEILEGEEIYRWAAFKVVADMPKWEPGKIDGEPVTVRYSLPLVFGKK